MAEGVRVGHRTDIWALGVVLCEMVTVKRPFRGGYDKAVMYSIVNEGPEPLTALCSGVPMEFEWGVGKALAKDFQSRYQRTVDTRELAPAHMFVLSSRGPRREETCHRSAGENS